MRYTYFGVGHSAMLRKVVKDCSESVSQTNVMDVANGSNDEDLDYEVIGDGEGFDECDNDEEDSDEECDDDVVDNDDEGYEDADEEFDDLSF
jgi:hypothetical protein